MSESESTSESSRGFPFRAVLAVSDGLLALACLLAFGILLGMLPFLNRLSTSYNLAPLMNASALISGLLVPFITFAAAAIMLPQKIGLSRVGAKIGALTDAVMLPVIIIIYRLVRTHPSIPVPPPGIEAAFALYVIMSVVLLALHIWYLVRTRKDTMRGAVRGYAFLLTLVAVNAVIIGAFTLHFSALQNGPNLTEYGQNWITEIAHRLLYDSDGLTLGYAFQVLALFIATILLVTGRRQYVLMGSVCAIAGYASMLIPFALTYREALKYDSFSFDRTPPPPNIGIDAGFVTEASTIAGCLLVLHIIALVIGFKPTKKTPTKSIHGKTKRAKITSIAGTDAPKETVRTVNLRQEVSNPHTMQNKYIVVLMMLCVALVLALAIIFVYSLITSGADRSMFGSATWITILRAIPSSCLAFAIPLAILHAKNDGYSDALRALERTTLGFYCCYAVLMSPGLVLLAAFTNSKMLFALVIIFCLSQIGIAIALIVSAGSNDPAKKNTRTALYAVLILLLLSVVLASLIPILSTIAHGRDLADYSYLVDSSLISAIPPFLFMLDFIVFAIRKRP